MIKERKKRAPRVKKTEEQVSEELAVLCCSSLKKAMKSGVFTDWEEVGFGENCKRWFQIKGLMNGNNIVISVSQEGRKKVYRMSLLSLQGTEIESEFDEFSYTHKDHVLSVTFMYGSKTLITHKVLYGE